ncbi:MAG: 23S rRNA (uracil1939-C5)-methyltransferase [Bacteriovoracaceae bacterium]|jgi:23S rRNA (uracil1939-C5)-methyltransferase
MKTEIIKFKIESLDSLGQGVSKIDDKITFIPKTLPGEEGLARIVGKKKGIQFAKVTELSNPSSHREEPACDHFKECSGCDFLHTSYETELKTKQASFERLLSYSQFKDAPVTIHGAPTRIGYRNRIQLHYDLKRKTLGFHKAKSNHIEEVPGCLLPSLKIQESLKALYENQSWIKSAPSNAPLNGHLELYELNEEVLCVWNENYAAAGFSQVNKEMNDLALQIWKDFYDSCESVESVYDVFGGSGNLTRGFTASKVTIFDNYCDKSKLSEHQRFHKTDLYKSPEVPDIPADLVIFDPPRSGFKETAQWLNDLEPHYVGYQSCFSDTMIRDLKKIAPHFEAISIHLLDFFPGTHHYESIIFLKNNRAN